MLLTKVARMHFGIIFPILMELTLIITYLLMLTQQYLAFPLIWSWCCCCYGWPHCNTLQWWWTEICACQLESEHTIVTTKELWELSRSLLSIMMRMYYDAYVLWCICSWWEIRCQSVFYWEQPAVMVIRLPEAAECNWSFKLMQNNV